MERPVKTKARRQKLIGARHAAPLQPDHDQPARGALEAERPLSPALAFVVQFRDETAGTSQRFTGRVEHMISGDAVRFRSPEELLTFFGRVLGAMQTNISKEQ
jgi:hypothetical protein